MNGKDVSLGTIQLIVGGNPDAIQVANNHGLFPLHVAFMSSTLDVIQYVLGLDASLMERVDGERNNHLHMAFKGGNLIAVKYLLEHHASMALVENKRNLLPIHLLCDASTGKDNNPTWGYISV